MFSILRVNRISVNSITINVTGSYYSAPLNFFLYFTFRDPQIHEALSSCLVGLHVNPVIMGIEPGVKLFE